MLYINPAKSAMEVTPSDDDKLMDSQDSDAVVTCRGISVGVAGDVAWKDHNGKDRIAKNLAAGIIHPIMTDQILATGTDAEEICAYW